MSIAEVVEYLPMGSYYLGELSKDLRDLKGFAVFAQELIQNADDAKGNDAQGRATKIVFDITADACIVSNDGSFSDCEQQNLPSEDCPWLSHHGHLCDLHRFRLRASADKRNEEGTTGGFGIGFVSVYQVTDHPELHTGNIHWRLHPNRPEHQRIHVLSQNSSQKGTCFILPWATDGETEIRRKLALEAVTSEHIETMVQEIADALPQAILFLRHLTHLELRRNGETLRRVVCLREEEQEKESNVRTLIVQDGADYTTWHIIEGSFPEEAEALRTKHGRLIENKRQSHVLLALPEEQQSEFTGRLCATLPTQEASRLPLHINADFYPSSNRKQILFGQDYQGEWNAAAIRAAARCLTAHLPELKGILDAGGIWALAAKAKSLSDSVSRTLPEKCFAEFWEALKVPLSTEKYIKTTSDTWTNPADVYLIKEPKDAASRQKFLIQANVNTVHPTLRSYYSLFRDREINVQELGAVSLAQHLQAIGLNKTIALTEAPQWMRAAQDRETLAGLITTFGVEVNNNWGYDPASKKALSECALVVSTEGNLCLPAACWRASAKAQQILSCLPHTFEFVSEDNPAPLLALCPRLRVSDIATHLSYIPKEELELIWQTSPEDWIAFLAFLDTASPEEWETPQNWLKQTLRSLPLWPNGESLFPLSELSVPGGFEDPLHLAMLLDARVIEGCTALLQKLSPAKLDLARYVTVELPKQFDSENTITDKACDQLIRVLAKHLGELRDNQAAQNALSKCPLILCTDGVRRSGRKVYLDSELVRDVLEQSVSIAVPAESDSIADLYRWSMATEMPRGEDVVARIQQICQELPVAEDRMIIQRLIVNLGRNWEKMKTEAEALKPLRTMEWIPAEYRIDKWFLPEDVYAIYSRTQFATQADFVDVSSQGACQDFFTFLGVPSQPTSYQIVNHLLACSESNVPVNDQVYIALQNRLNDPKQHEDILPALDKLKGTACLSMPGGYVRPSEVYWEETPYGRYARHLDKKSWNYYTLFDKLGVLPSPTTDNVFQIMGRISTEFGTDNHHLDDEAQTVLDRCWRYLNNQLATKPDFRADIYQHLGKQKIVLDEEGYLFPPWEMCFENRPHLANKFHENLRRRILIREQGTWQALEAAGVRPFSQIVTANPIDIKGEQEELGLTDRFHQRRYLIDRIIEPQMGSRPADWNLQLLEEVRIMRVQSILIYYEVEMGGTIVADAKESPDVFFDTSNSILYFRTLAPPWTALAREIVYALNPDVEAGTIAMTLSLVLSAETEQDAETALDEAGFARLERADPSDLTASTEISLNTQAGNSTETEGYTAPATSAPISSEADGKHESSSEQKTISTDEATENESDGQGEGETPQSGKAEASTGTGTSSGAKASGDSDGSGGHSEDTGTHKGGATKQGDHTSKGSTSHQSKGGGKESRSNTQGGRLNSYVSSKADGEEGDEDNSDLQEFRTELDVAGIAVVMDYERQRGRFPEEMEHTNPGFDIRSKLAGSQEIERYIEVKSMPVRWGKKGVGLTSTQFEFGKQHGEQYWLYIVECANTEEATVIPVQNPVQRIERFYFDSGWKGAAHSDEPPKPMLTLLDLKMES